MAIETGAIFKKLYFDGQSSGDYGVYISGAGTFNAPEREVEMVSIPGRNGDLALDKGRFENVEGTYKAGLFGVDEIDFAKAISDFRNFLCSRKGYVRLEDDYNPDEYRMAVYKDGLDVDAKQLKAGEFDIVFDCKPQRWLKSGEEVVTIGEWGETETATGEIVTIEATDTDAVKSLKVTLEPIQDLHGYDKPWVGGGGKNKLPNTATRTTTGGITFVIDEEGVVSASGTATADAYLHVADNVSLVSGQTYTLSGVVTASQTAYMYLEESVSSSWRARDYGSGATFSAPTNSVNAVIRIASGTTVNNAKFKPMIEVGSTATSYEPYSNICPISGRTEVVTQRTGKNLFDGIIEEGTLSSNGSNAQQSGRYRSKNFIPIKSGNTYVLSIDGVGKGVNYWFYDKNKVGIVSGGSSRMVAPSNACYLRFFYDSTILNANLQLELGSTATDYEPYQGETYTTDLGQTVYGGTLDVVSGVLTVTKGYIASYNGETITEPWISDRDEYVAGTTPTIGAQVVYTLATPQTYQLTAQQVSLLMGTNNVWSDAGEVTLEYGQNPNYLINPTLFAAGPLLEVEGYGAIEFNDFQIEIGNAVVGAVELAPGVNVTADESNRDYSSRIGLLDDSDPISMNGFTVKITARPPAAEYSSVSVTLAAESRKDIPNSVTPTIEKLSARDFRITCQFGGQSFVKGTQFYASNQYEFSSSWYTASGGMRVSRIIIRIYLTNTAEGATQIKVTRSGYLVTPTTGITASPVIGDSSISALGHPTYIDCDWGEAYKIAEGVLTPLNRYIDLGSDLPKLAPGANEITFDNTITELKFYPRWWKV